MSKGSSGHNSKPAVLGRAQQTAVEAKDHAGEVAGQAKEQIAAATAAVSEQWRDKAPQPVQDSALQAAGKARGNPKPLLVGAAALVVLLTLARRRKRR